MKYAFLFCLLFTNVSHAKKDIVEISNRYCDQKVKSACEFIKCHKTPDSCKDAKPDKATKEEIQKKMAYFQKSCPENDLGCMMQKVQEEAEAPLKELEKDCNKGNKDSCYQKELMEVMTGFNM